MGWVGLGGTAINAVQHSFELGLEVSNDLLLNRNLILQFCDFRYQENGFKQRINAFSGLGAHWQCGEAIQPQIVIYLFACRFHIG